MRLTGRGEGKVLITELALIRLLPSVIALVTFALHLRAEILVTVLALNGLGLMGIFVHVQGRFVKVASLADLTLEVAGAGFTMPFNMLDSGFAVLCCEGTVGTFVGFVIMEKGMFL